MSDPVSVTIAGIALRCRHCNNDKFTRRSALLDTSTASFFGLEWMNPTADVYVCSICGYLHYFLAPPVEVNQPPSESNDEILCLNCDQAIPPGFDRCQACGWTY
jgi:hypothetical protein